MSRRSISIDSGYIEALRAAADEKSSGTAMATRIATGAAAPLSKVDMSGSIKAVSMTEAIWLAIRFRAEESNQPLRVTFEGMLIGFYPPISKEELESGASAAKSRGEDRAAKKLTAQTPTPEKKTQKQPSTALDKVVEPDQEYYGGVFSL